MARTLKSITVDELIERLQDIKAEHGGEAMIAFSSNYGDYGKTQQVHVIDGEAEERDIEESGYSQSGFAVVEYEQDEDDAREFQKMVILT